MQNDIQNSPIFRPETSGQKYFGQFYTKSIYKIVQNILSYFWFGQGEKRSSSSSYSRVFSTMRKPKRNEILDYFVCRFGIINRFGKKRVEGKRFYLIL